jgi:hypothetical protein
VTEVRSYRRVFDLERRVYRIDTLRLNPGGVPLRGVVYLLIAVGAVALVTRVPVLGAPLRAIPWLVRFVALPALLAAPVAMVRAEGRPFHLAAHAIARRAAAPRWTTGFRRCEAPGRRWQPDELVYLPDGSEPRVRRVRCTGPGLVVVGRRRGAAAARALVLEPGESAVLSSPSPEDRA